jgi:protease-4
MSGESSISLFGGETLGSDTIVKALRQARDDESVAAIVLRVDSPGGSALASDLIWREIAQIEKPIIASMGDVAASGGYYISMGCDRIFAEPGTLTGSIGVVGGKIALGGLYEKLGLKTDVISRGRNSGLLSGEDRFTDSEREVWKRQLEETYRQFTTKAAEGRNMELDRLETLAGGRVWTGRQARENGLVDELGTLRDAMKHAKTAAGLPEDDKVETLILPTPKSFIDQLLGAAAGQGDPLASGALLDRATIGGATIGGAAIEPKLARLLGEAELFRRLFAEPSVLVLPYHLNIR